MTDLAIRVENLSKLYRIGAAQKRHDTLRDAISDLRFRISDFASRHARALLRSNHKSEIENHQSEDTIWALRNVSFEVKRGEVVGIIGRNGAGKSTLLKILSRITEPTEGRAIIDGRVGSLLEVGTGFHPELTGRENIYLNGAILGMKRAEIDRKFDEIVAFAEIEKFLDTPVKHYSSGMYVRLAFAVAAHLEPEILLVDEVLAVGDAAFQKKCLGKMGDVAREGRTVLFVSHNMFAIRGLSKRAMLIAEGQVQCSGDVDIVIERYLTREMEGLPNEIDTSNWKRPVEGLATDLRVTKVYVRSTNGEKRILSGKPFIVQMDVVVTRPVEEVVYGYAVFSLDGIRLFQCHNTNEGQPQPRLAPGKYRITAVVDNLPLPPGRYRLGIGVRCNAKGLDWIEELLLFEVEESQEIKSPWFKAVDGLFRQYSRWNVEVLS